MKSAYSKPPWKLLVDKPFRKGMQGSVMVAAGGPMAIDCTSSGPTFAEYVANGMLIAAAPGLAGTLALILQVLDDAAKSDAPDKDLLKRISRNDVRRILKAAGVQV